MLGTAWELYNIFREQNPTLKISFSKFWSLKPKWCVSPGSSGTHRVCVCCMHQNAELLALACGLPYKEMISALVCDVENRDCVIHRCQYCPGSACLRNTLIEKLSEIDENETLLVEQWTSTDRADLKTMVYRKDDLIEDTIAAMNKLAAHSYIAKSQANYLKHRKAKLEPHEAIVLADFAENYEFVIQNEIQSYHWCKQQCTIHPIAVYICDSDSRKVEQLSICFISEDLSHDTSFVYAMQKELIAYLKSHYPQLTQVEYFSDGCGTQYKNFKKFLNLTYHQSDFGIKASWSFFATSHGKSPCDGFGGSVKRKLHNASLAAPASQKILSTEAVFNYCSQNMP